jgi:hypothetical protein
MTDDYTHYCHTCDEYLTACEAIDHAVTHGAGHDTEPVQA